MRIHELIIEAEEIPIDLTSLQKMSKDIGKILSSLGNSPILYRSHFLGNGDVNDYPLPTSSLAKVIVDYEIDDILGNDTSDQSAVLSALKLKHPVFCSQNRPAGTSWANSRYGHPWILIPGVNATFVWSPEVPDPRIR